MHCYFQRIWRTLMVASVGPAMLAGTARAIDTVLLLKSRDLPQFNEASRGFRAEWTRRNATVPVREQTLGEPIDGTAPIAVAAIGTEAARWAITNTHGPVVFCMVANAQKNLLAPLSGPDAGRVSGVSLDVPVEALFQQMKIFLPRVKRVGVIYDPQKSATVVAKAGQVAAQLGLQLVPQEVAREADLPDAVSSMAGRIDLLWAPLDSTVYGSRNAEFVLLQMLERKIPVLGFSENMAKAGALLAPRIDHKAAGRQAAELLATTLQRGNASLGVAQPPPAFTMVVNPHVLKLMGNPIPEHALRAASFVHED